MACDRDRQILDTMGAAHRCLLPVRDSQSRVDVLRRVAFEAAFDLLSRIPREATVLLVAGLGGATGTGASPILAEALARGGWDVRAVLAMPFDFEGLSRRRLAEQIAREITEMGVSVYLQENQLLVEHRHHRPIVMAFLEYDLEIASRIRLA